MESRTRQQWADVAKGACIVLVVLWHVTRKDYLQLPWEVDLPITGAWGTVSESLLPVRMPLFFLISGLFAASQLRRPWRRVWTGRISGLLYLFVVWTLLHTVVLQATPDFDTDIAGSPRELLVQLTVTPGNLWYLLALALYVGIARATRAAPLVALGTALLLSAVASAGLVATPGNRAGLLTNLVWFLLGTVLPSVDGWQRARAWLGCTRSGLVLAVAAFVGAATAWQVLDADAWFGVRPVLGALGIGTGLALAPRLLATGRIGSGLASLGRQTLPVYVVHLPLVALLHLASTRVVAAHGSLASSPLVALAYPAVLCVLVVGASLGVHRLLVRGGAWWLFTAPWTRAREQAAVPGDAPTIR